MSRLTHLPFQKVVPLVLSLLLFSSNSLFAEEVSAPKPNIQLVMVGNTLVAVDNFDLPEVGVETIGDQASTLEREIMLRKLAETQEAIQETKLSLKKLEPKFNQKVITQKDQSTQSVLSNQTFFDHLDEEIIDSFRSANNFDNFKTRLLDFMDYRVGIYGEYDDNIFLTPGNKKSDFKTILSQTIEIQYPMDKFYLELDYNVNLENYGKVDDMVDTQTALGRLSYYPFDKFSVGVSNLVQKVGDSEVATSIGDQTLSLGFLTNNLRTDAKYEVWKDGFFEIFYNLEHIDFDEQNVQIFIDRDVHSIDARLRHRFNPRFSNYMGYRFKDVQFKDFPLKDQESSTLFYGADYEFPGWFTVFSEIGYESKDFKDPFGSLTITSTDPAFPFTVTAPFAPRRRQDNNVNFLFGIESNVSRYNTIGLTYNQRLVESSRPEFSQYLGRTFAVNSRTYIDNKTILFSSLFYELQGFDAKDGFNLLFPDGDGTTKVYASGITLRRILKDWLYFDIGYTYSRRTSDFPGEAYNNSRFRFGAQATF